MPMWARVEQHFSPFARVSIHRCLVCHSTESQTIAQKLPCMGRSNCRSIMITMLLQQVLLVWVVACSGLGILMVSHHHPPCLPLPVEVLLTPTLTCALLNQGTPPIRPITIPHSPLRSRRPIIRRSASNQPRRFMIACGPSAVHVSLLYILA